MRREEGEQCRSKRHCFSVRFLKRKEKKRKKRKCNLEEPKKWVMTCFIAYSISNI
jgi:hypothetical protein